MAIRDWTRGQMVLFWIILAFLCLVGSFCLAFWSNLTGRTVTSFWGLQEGFGLAAFFFFIFALPVGFMVTWRWLGRSRHLELRPLHHREDS